jgi:hypothetical protein
MIDARLTSGARAMPAVMGRATSSQNTASTETMLFVKSVEGVIKTKLDSHWSRHLTTAVRLMGIDAYVDFAFDPVSLRPQDEMLAFRQTKLSIMKDLLAMGFVSDEEFSIEMTGELPPVGHKPLSGTMFNVGGQNLATQQESSNSGSTLNQALNDTPPDTARGQNKKKAEDEAPEIEAQTQPTFITPNITLNVDNTQQHQATILKMKRDDDGNLIVERASAAS